MFSGHSAPYSVTTLCWPIKPNWLRKVFFFFSYYKKMGLPYSLLYHPPPPLRVLALFVVPFGGLFDDLWMTFRGPSEDPSKDLWITFGGPFRGLWENLQRIHKNTFRGPLRIHSQDPSEDLRRTSKVLRRTFRLLPFLAVFSRVGVSSLFVFYSQQFFDILWNCWNYLKTK